MPHKLTLRRAGARDAPRSDLLRAADVSYASAAEGRAAKVFIRAVENMSGRRRLLRRVRDYRQRMAQGRTFWDVVYESFDIRVDRFNDIAARIPAEGPLVVVANHPFGILDGLVMGALLSRARRDFRILANAVFVRADEIQPYILPIDFAETKEAAKRNIQARKAAVRYANEGGCVGVFPGGAVSTAARLGEPPLDPEWKLFAGRLILQTRARVLPLFFRGANGPLFQCASHVNDNLRLSLIVREFARQKQQVLDVRAGRVFEPEDLAQFDGRANDLMRYLRFQTYLLSQDPRNYFGVGKKWD